MISLKQKYELLELAIENDDMDLFFQGSGIYSLGDNKFYPVKRSVMADEALDIIYRYYEETSNESIIKEIDNCICEWLTYKSGKGIYKAFEILACMMKNEKEGKATFRCNAKYLCQSVSNAFKNNAELLRTIQENESESINEGMYELIYNENIYYYKKYGFLIIRNASEADIEIIRKYISEEFGLRDERLEKAVDKLTCYRDICEECLYWINNKSFMKEDCCLKIEGLSARELCDSTYLKPIGAYNYLVSLRNNPTVALADLKAGLPRK